MAFSGITGQGNTSQLRTLDRHTLDNRSKSPATGSDLKATSEFSSSVAPRDHIYVRVSASAIREEFLAELSHRMARIADFQQKRLNRAPIDASAVKRVYPRIINNVT